ncbi:ethanolamine ammonia-lyase subunit EutC [Hydrogenophaga laconesensis]|uniref:Ethanolamine ammonia-lyase small subunit n=1 Tax=Hydrogenophaga laconesensis TaxID=1805971 RepID=A0ABU1VD16_9BURK|nr:ethanolamine ammonia-lyase subunit EutC [Hydrogenophaga laconesensis]MDR7095373.1 ethanolamine ammonia-lyase small subunit [Hydrogenophaga laconesensis]
MSARGLPVDGPPVNGPMVPVDPWVDLRRHTPARIALGRAGNSLPTDELLRFSAAHARARDAVHVALDTGSLAAALTDVGWPPVLVASQAPSRQAYLRRPDQGRRLRDEDLQRLRDMATSPVDLVVVIGDGLSALAVQSHALEVLTSLHKALAASIDDAGPLDCAPLVVATQARVALADDVGAALQARLALILVGERPGLSAADSLGAYLTLDPRVGRTDAERNCVSNIRPEGLVPQAAGQRLAWLVREALRRGLTGVGLKDNSAVAQIPP